MPYVSVYCTVCTLQKYLPAGTAPLYYQPYLELHAYQTMSRDSAMEGGGAISKRSADNNSVDAYTGRTPQMSVSSDEVNYLVFR